MSEKTMSSPPLQGKKYVKTSEFIGYLIAVFFYTNLTGFAGQYRILMVESK